MDELHERLKKFARDQRVDLFGVADLTPAREFIRMQGGELIGQFPRAISIGMRLLDAIVDELYRHEDLSAVYTYRGLYNSVNANLDRVALLIAERVQQAGYMAYPLPASQIISARKLEGAISHKLVAHLAGLGWIGKSCLLITPDYGPRVRWATILTDAPMEVGAMIPNQCGSCRECVDICPPKAFTGVPFDSSEPRDVRFRAHLCDEYMDERKKRLGQGICGLCVHICPHGRPKH
jgi:epoxyqueuosine reductase